MIRTVLLFLATTAALPWSAFAQCDFQSVYRGAYRTTALDLAVDGDDLWEATSFGVLVYDRRSIPPIPRTSLALPATTSAVEPAGDTVYAASGSSIYAVRRNGARIEQLGSVNVGEPVYELQYVAPYLYAGTSAGIVQLDLLDPATPFITTRLSTSAGPALSLAAVGSHLYAADGDGTVDVYTLQIPALPQRVGAFSGLFQNVAVHAVADRLYVSDGVQTKIFFGGGPSPSAGETSPAGSTSFFGAGANIAFMAGPDRTLRAVDYSDPFRPLGLMESTLPASFGTVNRITAIAGADQAVYVAAGDGGLVTYDLSEFKPPFPLVQNRVDASSTLFSSGGVVVSASRTGGLRKYQQNNAGVLSLVSQWDGERQSKVLDGAPGRALTGSGSSLTLWDTTSSTPVAISAATLSAPFLSGVLVGTTAWVVLSDHSVWRIDVSQSQPTPVAVPVAGSTPSYIARSGLALALADLTDDGKTVIRYFPTGDLAAAGSPVAIDGAATGGIALSSDGRVAAVTFRGLQIADFRSSPPAVTVVPDSSAIVRDLLIENDQIILLSTEQLDVRDLSTGVVDFTIPVAVSSADISVRSDEARIVSVATGDGITSVNLSTASKQPQLRPVSRSDRYFRKVVAAGDRLYLFDGRRIDFYLLSSVGLPAFIRQVAPEGSAVDVAAGNGILWVLTAGGEVLGYGLDGTLAAQYAIDEGSDVVTLSIRELAGALYVSVNRGCLSGGCEKKTIVLQRSGNILIPTATLPGAMLDATVDGSRGYALFEGPDEIRVLDLGDPLHPGVIRASPTEGKPVSIAHSPALAALYAIGQRVYAYDAGTLAKRGELLDPYQSDGSHRLTYLDQTVELAGSCAVVVGRTFQPRVFRLEGATNWSEVAAPPAAAAGRSMVVVQGRLYLLTDYSLEIWSTEPIGGRRRP